MHPDWRRAVESNGAASLTALIEAGLDVDALDRHGQTGLMLAARFGHADVVRALVEAGADLNRTAKYQLSALMQASINNRVSVVKLLVDAGADTTIRGSGAPGFYDKTALDIATQLGRDSIVALLSEVESDR